MKNKLIVAFVCLFSFVSHSLELSERAALENTSAYRWANYASFVIGLGSIVLSSYYLYNDDDETQESMVSIASCCQAACSLVVSGCAAKICGKLPPLTSLFNKKKPVAEKSKSRQEMDGLLLWVQDTTTRAATMSLIFWTASYVPMPTMAQAESINMAAWCSRHSNSTQFSHDDAMILDAYAPVSINFVVIPPTNRSTSPQLYLTGATDPKQILKSVVTPLMEWTRNCSSCILQYGYDAALENPRALVTTQQLICDQFAEHHVPLDKLYFLDVRTLPGVKEYLHLLDPLKIDVYLLVDVLRLEQTLHAANTLSEVALYADLDIGAFPVEGAFLARLWWELRLKDFILPLAHESAYENSFFVFSKQSSRHIKDMLLAPAIKVLNAHMVDGAEVEQDFVFLATVLACLSQNPMARNMNFASLVDSLNFFNQKSGLSPLTPDEIKQFVDDIFLGNIVHYSVDVIKKMVGFFSFIEYKLWKNNQTFCPVMDLPTQIAHPRTSNW